MMQSEAEPVLLTSRGSLYRLTEQADPYDQAERSSFGVEPETGTVCFVLPDGEAWFADSGVDVWLDVLHHYVVASPPQSFSASRRAPRSTSPKRRKSGLSPS
ncbi:hypothetical protein [Streptomyces sp. NPDC127114]|uniref:hypothetical protein n=1 Tax=Streptomyces sp. NPDC127114 TaxID=3345366 RepID=UPI0036329B01